MPKILYALTTYDAYAYIDLSITMHKKFGNDVIVIDDGSYSNKLYDVCLKHNVPLIGLSANTATKFDEGDVRSTVQAIQYAYFHGYDYVAKQSRRWIWLENPTPRLIDLINQSDAVTISNYTISWNFKFRTEFTVYRLKEWIQAVKTILIDFKNKKKLGLVQKYMHNIAKLIEPKNDLKYNEYLKNHPYPPEQNGYIHFDFMGNDKKHMPKYILFHNTNPPQDYLKISQQEGLNYDLNDFKIIASSLQKGVL